MNLFSSSHARFFAAIFLISVGCLLGYARLAHTDNASQAKPASEKIQHPSRGSENAPLKIELFSDFYCPYCKKQANVFAQLRKKYPNAVYMTFRHFPLSGEPGAGSFPLHEASVCAEAQGKFWELHDYVYSAKTHPQIEDAAHAAGLEEAAFKSCMEKQGGRSSVLADLEDAHSRGIDGAPTFFVNGEKVSGMRGYNFFLEKVDPELAAKNAAERKKQQQELESRINFSETGRPAQGEPAALVTITEFSDFHCPFCVRLTATLKQVMELYPKDVRRVWRHFPLPIHPFSPYGHLASECAHNQGQFWAFHEQIFKDPGAAHSESDFLRIAEMLKLDTAKFKSCYEDVQTKKKVENDVLLGMSKHVGSTPTFFVNDEMFVGAKSLEAIKAIIDRKLAEAKKKSA